MVPGTFKIGGKAGRDGFYRSRRHCSRYKCRQRRTERQRTERQKPRQVLPLLLGLLGLQTSSGILITRSLTRPRIN
jgi:hypothetical protein